MSIPESTLSKWSHHQASTAFKQAHVPIRETLDDHKALKQFKYDVFLQGSYKNDTNLGGDSDVDVVVRLSSKLKPAVAELTGERLQKNGSHTFVYGQWKSFRDEALKAMRARFGKTAESGRKTLKVPKGKIPADADLVVTVSHREGIGFYLPDEERWVVSFPQQHHDRGLKKEKAANRRFKRTIRMFKAARNRLVDRKVLTKDDAPSYFIECLLYNVPNGLFAAKLAPTYTGIVDWLKTAKPRTSNARTGRCLSSDRGLNSGLSRRREHSSRLCGNCGRREVESGNLRSTVPPTVEMQKQSIQPLTNRRLTALPGEQPSQHWRSNNWVRTYGTCGERWNRCMECNTPLAYC